MIDTLDKIILRYFMAHSKTMLFSYKKTKKQACINIKKKIYAK